MKQIHSVLGKDPKACVRTARVFDDKMDEFGHTLCILRFIVSEESQKMDYLRPIFEPIHTQIALGGTILTPVCVENARNYKQFLALFF